MKRGDISVILIVGIVSIIVFAVLVYSVANKFGGAGGFNDVVRLLPSFLQPSQKPNADLGLVGIDLRDGLKLKVYSGSSWVELKEGSTFKINNRTYDYSIGSRLQGYYFNLPRLGRPVFQLSDGSDLKVVSLEEAGLGDKIIDYKSGEVGKFDFTSETYMFLLHENTPEKKSINDQSYFFDSQGYFYKVSNSGEVRKVSDARELALLNQARSSIVAWRDQFLQGGSCQSFLTIDYNGGRGSEKYGVRRVDYMLYVDLNEPANGAEKYQEGCFINPVGYYSDDSQLKIRFDNFNGFTGISWGTPGAGCLRQWYIETDFGGYIALSSEGVGAFRIPKEDSVNFKDGLVAIAKRLEDLGVENVAVYSLSDDPDLQKPLVEFKSFGNFIGTSDQDKIVISLEDARAKLVRVVPIGSVDETFYDKSGNDKPKVKIGGEGEITYRYSGPSIPDVHKVRAEVLWDSNGLQGSGWYGDGKLFSIRSSIDSGNKYSYEQYPYILFSNEAHRNSFDEGLPLVLEGFGVPQWIESPRVEYVNVYPFLEVKIISESDELDISKEVNRILVKNGPSSDGKNSGILTNFEAQHASALDPVASASRLISYNYYSIFENDYC